LLVASDLESSHNVAALRIKDAIDPRGITPKEPGRLVLVSPRWGEMADFAEPFDGVWLQPRPGYEAATLAAIGRRLMENPEVVRDVRGAGVDSMDILWDAPTEVPGVPGDKMELAVQILLEAVLDRDSVFSAVYAPDPIGSAMAAETAKAVANLSLIVQGPRASQSLHVLPTEVNAWGFRDMGAAPDVLPGLRLIEDGAGEDGSPNAEGLDFNGVIEGALAGRVKAVVVVGDNPLLWAPARRRVREALEKLDCLVVIDSLPTETARAATVVLADVPTYGKDGTYTTADRRVVRLQSAIASLGEARPAWESLAELGRRLAEKLSVAADLDYPDPSAVMDEITFAAAYAGTRYDELLSGKVRPSLDGAGQGLSKGALRPVALPEEASTDGGLILITGRTLYTSLDGAGIRSPDADKLHREEYVELNPADAEPLGIHAGEEVVLTDGSAEMRIRVALSAAVPPGVAFVPLLYDGGAVTALFPPDDASFRLPHVRVAVPQPA
jgi:predicted molibdopterin-dependent oxidoreductase YjgC